MKATKINFSFLLISLLAYVQVAVANDLNLVEGSENEVVELKEVNFKNVTLKNFNNLELSVNKVSNKEDKDGTSDFGSPWAWPEFTLEMVDSYMPFIFRTKSSEDLDEIRVILNVNDKGKLVGYEFLTEADRGLEQRIAHVLRKLPNCIPVPGYVTYGATDFELIIKK
jgi:hypothetical protein